MLDLKHDKIVSQIMVKCFALLGSSIVKMPAALLPFPQGTVHFLKLSLVSFAHSCLLLINILKISKLD